MKQEKKVYQQIGVRVNNDLLKQITEFAEKEQRSISQVMRMAIVAYMEKQK